MVIQFKLYSTVALCALVAQTAFAQDSSSDKRTLPPLDVTSSRLGTGIVGASTTVITSEDIQRAPEATVQDLLSREAGIQLNTLYGGVNGTGTSVDMRGFGNTAPSNVLVLVDGRRFNDSDLTGFDFSLIPRQSIERIEVTRGNSGAVLYGDGAVGGVINIITKKGVGAKPNARIEAGFGTFNTREGNVSASASHGAFSTAVTGKSFTSDGYRANNKTTQNQGVGDIRYTVDQGSAFFNIAVDDLKQRLPGPRNITSGPFFGNYNELASDPSGTSTPLDWVSRTNLAVRGGVTRNVWDGVELILDGSVRQKKTDFASFTATTSVFSLPNIPSSFNSTNLDAYSITPRVNFDRSWGDVRVKSIAGVDVYRTNYGSQRRAFEGATPNHIYDLNQTTTGLYAQPTITFRDNTDISFGVRVQRNTFNAVDSFDAAAPVGPNGVAPGAIGPLHTTETHRATHLGIEHRFSPAFAVFARMAESFRVPNLDERIGATAVFVPTTFDLRTQKSRDYEGGVRVRWGRFDLQSSVYDMYLTDELHFSPITGANANFDPTRRYGFENAASWAVTDTVKLRGAASYTRSVFRSGPFAGNDVPQVSRWTGSVGASWNIYQRYLMLDASARFAGRRYIDGDEANGGLFTIPAYGIVDMRLGGEIDKFFWSINVQNLFDNKYYDYALDTSFPGTRFVSVYTLPGRVFTLRAGATF